MNKNKWSEKGIPHKGWVCVYVEDLEEPEFVCEMCGQEEIRYVHYMKHEEFPNIIHRAQKQHITENQSSQYRKSGFLSGQ